MDATLQAQRMARAERALIGLSVGDAFGRQLAFAEVHEIAAMHARNEFPPAPHGSPAGTPWPYTDDTEMALSVVAILRRFGTIDGDALAQSFVAHFNERRGYGMAMFDYMDRVHAGEHWHAVSHSLFGGKGSYGNGAAMRVAPLGAFFADTLAVSSETIIDEVRKSAIVTHAHAEGIAGAMAVALAAGWAAWQAAGECEALAGADFIARVLADVPVSETRAGIEKAVNLPAGTPIAEVARTLGNGHLISAMDTVPYVLWCAAHHLDVFADALWLTAEGLGDVDTTCAMVGGIVASTAPGGVPAEWRARTEDLPAWAFADRAEN